jgi:hypothetical protein
VTREAQLASVAAAAGAAGGRACVCMVYLHLIDRDHDHAFKIVMSDIMIAASRTISIYIMIMNEISRAIFR